MLLPININQVKIHFEIKRLNDAKKKMKKKKKKKTYKRMMIKNE